MKILGIVPARYASARFPAKALVDINGKSMVQRTYERAKLCSDLADVVVATDHDLIFEHCTALGINVVMTSDKHESGTDRCYEAYQKFGKDFDFVINIQGDEPFIEPKQISELAACFDTKTELATLVRKINKAEILFDENKVKAVLDGTNMALYFSRAAIPAQRGVPKEEWLANTDYYLHVGIYGYRTDVLSKITQLPLGKLEQLEALEQLRWLENGYSIQANITQYDSHGVDTEDDLQRLLELHP